MGLLSTLDEVADLQAALDDTDDPFSWDLDIIVGPEWRSVKTAAPLVAVTDVHSSNADSDDNFQFAVSFRSSKWSVQNLGGQEDRMQRRGFFAKKPLTLLSANGTRLVSATALHKYTIKPRAN